jgi:uncharacterized membrane protein YvbJ
MASSQSDDFQCRNCGAEIHPNARACKSCGTLSGSPSAKSLQAQHLDGIDLPHDPGNDPDFDYDDYVSREFGDDKNLPIVIDGRKVIWWLTAVILVLVFAYLATRG